MDQLITPDQAAPVGTGLPPHLRPALHDAAHGVGNIRGLALVARGLLILFVLGCLLITASGVAIVLQELQFGMASLPLTMMVAVHPLVVGLLLLCAIPVMLWTWRAHANLHDLGLSGLTRTPGWATASYLVPLANLVVPFRAMRELYNRSSGEDAWQAELSVGNVTSWWGCLMAAVVIDALLLALFLLDGLTPTVVLTPPGASTGLAVFSLLLLAGSAFYLWKVIGAITRAQLSHATTAQAFA